MGKRSEQIDELTAEVARLREEVARLRTALGNWPLTYTFDRWIEPGYVPDGVKIWCTTNKTDA